MNPPELVDHIRSGPADLVLDSPLRFRGRTCSNTCNFNKFLQALKSSETIQIVECNSFLRLGISEDEWSFLSRRWGAFAEAVSNAQTLCILTLSVGGETLPRDLSGLTAFAKALREHEALQEFTWSDACSRVQLETAHITALDHMLRVLPACPHLRKVTIMTKFASANAVKDLLQLQSDTELRLILETDNWVTAAEEIRHCRCNVQRVILSMQQGAISEATEAVKVIASAIQLDCNLERLCLQIENGFTDEAGMVLAEALTVNKTLRKLHLSDQPVNASRTHVENRAALGARAYEALSAMLRVNTSLVLMLPPFERTSADERLRKACKEKVIDKILNKVGRGRLLASSSHTTREESVDALLEMTSNYVEDDEQEAL